MLSQARCLYAIPYAVILTSRILNPWFYEVEQTGNREAAGSPRWNIDSLHTRPFRHGYQKRGIFSSCSRYGRFRLLRVPDETRHVQETPSKAYAQSRGVKLRHNNAYHGNGRAPERPAVQRTHHIRPWHRPVYYALSEGHSNSRCDSAGDRRLYVNACRHPLRKTQTSKVRERAQELGRHSGGVRLFLRAAERRADDGGYGQHCRSV